MPYFDERCESLLHKNSSSVTEVWLWASGLHLGECFGEALHGNMHMKELDICLKVIDEGEDVIMLLHFDMVHT
jgi:hypothetical protein